MDLMIVFTEMNAMKSLFVMILIALKILAAIVENVLNIAQDIKKEECSKREKPPYVCNGCKIRAKCHLEKRTYDSILAQKQYKGVLKETKSGIAISEAELQYVSDLTYPLLRKGQSLHHIYETHKDEILVPERTLYSFIKQRSLEAGPLDMPRMVKYKLRVNTNHKKLKVDKKCYIGRIYADYNIYLAKILI